MSSEGGPAEEHEEHGNHEAWVIPYADLLTLLMAMFIALFAMSTVDQAKVTAVANGFKEAIGGKVDSSVFAGNAGHSILPGDNQGSRLVGGGKTDPTAVDDTSSSKLTAMIDAHNALQNEKAVQIDSLKQVEAAIVAAATHAGVGDKLSLELQNRGLVIRIVTDQVLFPSGSAVIEPEGAQVLAVVGNALKTIDNPIIVEGHTDNLPIDTALYPSNWELSGARAGAVVRFFTSLGLAADRMRPQGFADTRPLASNDTAAGRAKNRRVEIVVQSKVIDALLNQDQLDNQPATTNPLGADPQLNHVVGSLKPVG
jgi:chemotaxis protein MotB